MAILHKRKSTGSYTWTSSDLASGQIGINLADATLHIKRADNALIEIGHNPRVNTVSYASTISANVFNYDIVRVSLTGNITSFGLTGGLDGQKVLVEFIQDATGSRTVTFDSSIRFGTDITSITLTTTASKMDRIGFVYNATANKYDVVAVVKGF